MLDIPKQKAHNCTISKQTEGYNSMQTLEGSLSALDTIDKLIDLVWFTPEDRERLQAKGRELGLQDFIIYLADREIHMYESREEAIADFQRKAKEIQEGK